MKEQVTFKQISMLTAAVLITLLLFLAFFFRYQITPLGTPTASHKLDRLTGTVYICGDKYCIPLEVDPFKDVVNPFSEEAETAPSNPNGRIYFKPDTGEEFVFFDGEFIPIGKIYVKPETGERFTFINGELTPIGPNQ